MDHLLRQATTSLVTTPSNGNNYPRLGGGWFRNIWHRTMERELKLIGEFCTELRHTTWVVDAMTATFYKRNVTSLVKLIASQKDEINTLVL